MSSAVQTQRAAGAVCYRSFRNADTPSLVELWRLQADAHFAQPVTTAAFENGPLARPYFDNCGLIVALSDDCPVGWIHAGFGPSPDGSQLDPHGGVVGPLVMHPQYGAAEVPAELLRRAVEYLRSQGASLVHGGGAPWAHPYYLGWYGGSQIQGPTDSQAAWASLLRSAGFAVEGTFAVLHRELTGFRPAISRRLMQVRRSTTVLPIPDLPSTWWDACAYAGLDRVRYELWQDGKPHAAVLIWALEPLSHRWGRRAAGLVDLWTLPGRRRQGLAVCLVGEVLRQLAAEGYALVEAQVALDNAPAMKLFTSLGFNEVEQGSLLAQRLPRAAPAQ